MSQTTTSITPTLGKDIIYICQACEHREKEFSLPNRNYKYCQKCGSISIKATLVDSYNYIVASAPVSYSKIEEDTTTDV
jgi:PHP family Zn ribbon phosphoesterase